jgi:hypothetical protein
MEMHPNPNHIEFYPISPLEADFLPDDQKQCHVSPGQDKTDMEFNSRNGRTIETGR